MTLLLDAGADVNVKDDSGWTPLYHAASEGHTEIAKLLLDAGADVNVKDDSGWTPLHHTASGGLTEIAKLLLDAGADVNVKDDSGWTPLYHTASGGHTEIATLLLDAGADVNVKDDSGWTPLHHAASEGHTEIAKLLLDASADVNVKGDSGWTPLHDAASGGHTEIAKLLLGVGADVNVKDNDGWTPRHHAAWYGHNGVTDLLFRGLSSSYASTPEDALPESPENRDRTVLRLFKSLVLEYPNDSILRLSLGNEYMRQKMYKDASIAFDMSLYLTMREMKATRVEDIIIPGLRCDDCNRPLRGSHYKCSQCYWNYGLCQECMETSNHEHPGSDLIVIPSKDLFSLDGEQPE